MPKKLITCFSGTARITFNPSLDQKFLFHFKYSHEKSSVHHRFSFKVVWNFTTSFSLFSLFCNMLFPTNAKITLGMLNYLFLDKFMF